MSESPAAVTLDQGRAAFATGGPDPGAEHVALDHPGLDRRFLAEPILADRDLPPFNRATMDGIAARSTDVRSDAVLLLAQTIGAGRSPGPAPPPGQAVAIATGAAVPEGLDVVVEKERLIQREIAKRDFHHTKNLEATKDIDERIKKHLSITEVQLCHFDQSYPPFIDDLML